VSQKPPLRRANEEPMRARSGRQFQHSQYSLVRLTLDTLYALAPVTRRYALCITFTQGTV
jgi:hypothetical protein